MEWTEERHTHAGPMASRSSGCRSVVAEDADGCVEDFDEVVFACDAETVRG
jgi:hypothetical protein